MSRVAKWKRGRNDPETMRGWLLHGTLISPSESEKAKHNPRKLKFIGIGFIAYFVAAIGLFAFRPHLAGQIVPLLNLPFIAGSIVSAARRKKAPLVDAGPGESARVTLTIHDAKGLPTGKDAGRLIHSEGWILFEGERTSFAFTRGEARPARFENAGNFVLEDRRKVAFWPEGDRPDFAHLERIVAAWNASPIPDGEAVLPPTDVHPQHWSDAHTAWILGAVVCFACGLFGWNAGWWIIEVIAFAGLIACIVGARLSASRLSLELKRVLPAPEECERHAITAGDAP